MSDMLEKQKETTGRVTEVDEELRRRAEAIALFMGGDYNMTASVGPYGSGWHWDFVNNHVNMDAKDLLEEDEDVVRGVASHEGNHRSFSRPDYVKDLWQEPGFAFGYNAMEDPRVNQGGMKFRPGSKKWIKAYIDRDLGPGGGLDYQGMQQEARDRLGYVPKHMQWGAEMIRYWHDKELSGDIQTKEDVDRFLQEIPDESVREKIASSISNFEDFYQALPDSKDEVEVRKKAKESSRNFKDKIWPSYKELVKQAYEDQSMVRMAQDEMDDQKSQSQSDQQGGSSLPQSIKNEIKERMEDSGSSSGSKSQSEQNQNGQRGQEESKQSQSGQENQQFGSGTGTSEGQKESGQKPTTIPWDKLSDKAKQAIMDAFDQLPEFQKNKYREQAKRDLEDAEDDANEKLRGKMIDPNSAKTHKEQREADEHVRQDQDAQLMANELVKEMEERRKKILEQMVANPYHEVLVEADVAATIRKLDHEYKRIFSPDENPSVRHSYAGLRPSMYRAMQKEADPKRGNVFEIKGRPLERSHRFLWLVDMSGSVQHIIPEVFKFLVIATELSNKYGLESSIVGFTDSFPNDIKVYKDFSDKRLNKQVRDQIGMIIPDCMSMASGTPTIEATRESFKILKKRMNSNPMQHNYFITLTDGVPNSGAESLKQEIEKLQKDRSIVTCGFGIGPGTDFVNEAYPPLHERIKRDLAKLLGGNPQKIGSSFQSAIEFANASVIIMKYMVEHPELFH